MLPGGIPVFETDLLPMEPSDGEVARRIVRRGLAERLPWLKIDPGPEPHAPTQFIIAVDPAFGPGAGGPVVFASRGVFAGVDSALQRREQT